MPKNLLLHAGAVPATLAEVAAVHTPEGSAIWQPIPHHVLYETIRTAISETDNMTTVMDEEFALWGEDGSRFFASLTLKSQHDDYATLIGVRNSHDKTFSAGIVCGARVFICDNRSFSGEVRMDRRHTVNILRDLPGLANRALGRLFDLRGYQDKRIEAYKGAEIDDKQVNDFVIRSLDARIIPAARIPAILGEWRKPSHEEFAPRTLWSLFNDYTEVLKGTSFYALTHRTMALHGMMDRLVGIEAPKAVEVIGEAEVEDADFVIEE